MISDDNRRLIVHLWIHHILNLELRLDQIDTVFKSYFIEQSKSDIPKILVDILVKAVSQHPQQVYDMYTKTIAILEQRSREDFLKGLASLMPFILAIAGDEAPQAADDIYSAIQEVCEWWP